MACFVSLCSFTDFTTRKTLIIKPINRGLLEFFSVRGVEDLQAQMTHNFRLLLSSSTCSTGIHFLGPKLCGKELVSMKRCDNPADAGYLDYKDVCTSRVISGFWVGPDIEDGWGFVEATVNEYLKYDYL